MSTLFQVTTTLASTSTSNGLTPSQAKLIVAATPGLMAIAAFGSDVRRYVLRLLVPASC